MKLSEIIYRAAAMRAEKAEKSKSKKKYKKHKKRKSVAGLVWIPNKIRKKFTGAVR